MSKRSIFEEVGDTAKAPAPMPGKAEADRAGARSAIWGWLWVLLAMVALMVVVGGLGSIHGAYYGAIVIGLLPVLITMARDFISDVTGAGNFTIPGLEIGIFALILVGFIIIEPLGIYGRWTKIRIWLELFPMARKDMFRRQKSYLKTERMK